MVWSLVALKFNAPHEASHGLELAVRLEKQQLLPLIDAAIVAWPHCGKRLDDGQANGLTWAAECDAAICGAMRSLADYFAARGVEPSFFEQVHDKVTVDTSVLFLLLGWITADRLLTAFRTAPRFEIIAASGDLELMGDSDWGWN